MLTDHGAEFVEDGREPLREWIAGRQFDAAKAEAIQFFAAIEFDHAVAGAFGATINPQNTHLQQFTRRERGDDAENVAGVPGRTPLAATILLIGN
jgi:hypothetical protein